MKIIRILHILLSIAIAGFFIYSGSKKFIPKPAPSKPVDNSAFVTAFETNHFESPTTFKMGVKALKVSGFLKMVGVFQILAGLLILLSTTRLIGLLILLPITVNIFCFHFFMDNEVSENIETGAYLLVNILLVAYYYKTLGQLLLNRMYPLKLI